ncbi:trans-aconitate 2-methyltransferase [Saxibacter everestensis]|uniref:Trans-aconitate 2-methyltransferase n=1 Tax=Saxibacter everestensis TaxID=2909229 RepID=A0ABY8QNT1_9MICO|nr:trans-aconitate 2-methyltransferase [Brevibacteriaceae bacterium ZFBP1038]
MNWDPDVYQLFSDDRSRPFFDLLSAIRPEDTAVRRVVDLGCGPGNLTAALARRWPAARISGLDSDGAMITKARADHGSVGSITFTQSQIESWTPDEQDDVVISNAALQWVPGHRALLGSWLTSLRPGAWIGWQVPGNFAAPSHRLMRGLAESPRWSGRLGDVLRHEDVVAGPAEYLSMLQRAGFAATVWETSYLHVLTGENPVLDWVRGTALLPILAALDAHEADEFIATYSTALREAYPASEHGTVFPFRRVFAVGRKL